MNSLYTDVYLIFHFILFEDIGERSEHARTSPERETEKERTLVYFLFPPPPPPCACGQKIPCGLYLVTRARRTLKRK